ncbi:MAG: bifunctional glutamate N-acetyltransferase/amino-acid acetyltransferase ArgJ [Kiritimatiellae bacterium]|nr:bifunctional glutamate N-acetyltransferase/amino-acid acetyltransferase ArgJ [Kiritimatiellia bacterium]
MASLGVTYPRGFKAAGVAAAVKYANRRDFALIVPDTPASVAAVFTTNAVAAAPVRYDRAMVRAGRLSAIAVNTGFANACTGARGEADVVEYARLVSDALGVPAAEVAVCSTGVIGAPLPMGRIAEGVRLAASALAATPEAADNAAHAIMTTDTVPKQAALSFSVNGHEVRIGGMSKGAGMIEPNMATMLAFVTTDAAVAPGDLDTVVREAAGASFNRIVIDNDRSTNDSLFLVAGGASGVTLAPGLPGWDDFRDAVKALCLCLAKQNVMDGEGVSKFVTVTVSGAKSAADAQLAARAIARSMLVKTSWYGADPNWGRVICAVGYSGAAVEETKTTISYNGLAAFDKGAVAGAKTLEELSRILKNREFSLDVNLGLGDSSCTLYTSDLTHEYVNINADYTT